MMVAVAAVAVSAKRKFNPRSGNPCVSSKRVAFNTSLWLRPTEIEQAIQHKDILEMINDFVKNKCPNVEEMTDKELDKADNIVLNRYKVYNGYNHYYFDSSNISFSICIIRIFH